MRGNEIVVKLPDKIWIDNGKEEPKDPPDPDQDTFNQGDDFPRT